MYPVGNYFSKTKRVPLSNFFLLICSLVDCSKQIPEKKKKKKKIGGHRARLGEKDNFKYFAIELPRGKSLTFCTSTRPCAR